MPDLPTHVRGFLEHFDENVDDDEPATTAWLAGDRIFFAALYFIDRKPWLVRGELREAPLSGHMRIGAAYVEPWGRDDEVTGTILRKLRLPLMLDEALYQLRWRISAPADWATPANRKVEPTEESHALTVPIDEARKLPRRGRRGYPDAHYAMVAEAFLGLCAKRSGRDVYGPLAASLGVTRGRARQWVRRATEKQFLAPGQRGRTGRRAGPRLTYRPNSES
jgi:hypothetical protein